MVGRFKIDGNDAWTQWKVAVREGGYNQYVCLPSMKDVETNDWYEHDGIEADLSSPVGDTRTFIMDFMCAGSASDIESFLLYLRTPFIDSQDISHGVYHTFDGVDIGGKQVVARVVSLSSVDLGTMRSPLLFSLTFADDSGFSYDADISIPPSEDDVQSDFTIDGIPFRSFGIKMLDGTINGLLSGAGVKDGLSINVSDVPGVIYDISSYGKRKSRNFTLKCHMKSMSFDSMWNNYLALENLLFMPGSRTVMIPALGISYKCYYVSCSVQNFFPDSIWIDFNLTFKILGWS